MATILDIGLIETFTPVFSFLFIFAVLFAILEKTKILGQNRGLNSLVSFTIAMLFLFTEPTRDLIKSVTPWFVILMVFVVFLLLIFLFIGIKEEEIAQTASQPGVVWFIIIVLVLIMGAILTQVFGEQVRSLTEEGNVSEGSVTTNVAKIVFHPRILGAMLLLVIASQAVRLISRGL